MPRPAAAAALPDTAGQPPADDTDTDFWTRFPARWLNTDGITGDTLRTVTLVSDYARGRDGYCWAADRTLAAALHLHPRTVAAALRTAEEAGLVTATRRRGGTSARTIAQAADDELMVCVSATARNALSGARWLAYCALSVRQHLGDRTSLRRIATMCGIGMAAARAAVAELLATGWVTRTDTAGAAATYTVHTTPVPGIPTQLALFAEPRRTAAARPAPAPAPAAVECDGQLALFDQALTPVETTPTTPPDSAPTTPVDLPHQTGSLEQALSNRLGVAGGCGAGAAETPVPRDAGGRPGTRVSAVPAPRPSAAPEKTTTTLPPLLVTPQIRTVLAEVPASLIDRMSRWEQRQAARAVGAAIREAGGDTARVAARLVRRWALADPAAISSPYGWLTRRGLTRRGCDLPQCESGFDVDRDTDCVTCGYWVEQAKAKAAAARILPAARTGQQQPAEPRPPRPRYCPTHSATVAPCGMCAAPAVPEPASDPAARARALGLARTARATYRGTTPVAA
ncbi:hypothetical protein [Kitasatospora cineracea]|uniref:hypothetical protein n=1 Tax=Kitasatospora cineracea TaxID=88074 RepID=UPI0036744765